MLTSASFNPASSPPAPPGAESKVEMKSAFILSCASALIAASFHRLLGPLKMMPEQ